MTAPAIRPTCAECGTLRPPGALVCPICKTLVHADTLKALAAQAEAQHVAGARADERATWARMLTLLPDRSQQAITVRERIAAIDAEPQQADVQANVQVDATAPKPPDTRPWWKRGAGAIGTAIAFALTKAKFLLLGLSKMSTLLSMFAFFGLYWAAFGWPFALGVVFSIYIHEMGHVSELRRLGIKAGAPLFIPGVGAVVMLKQRVTDPRVDARIGLAGPLWGLGAGLVAFAGYAITGIETWGAIAKFTGIINLFNLIPVWQLDGSRGLHALTRWQRLVVAAVAGGMYFVFPQLFLLIIAAAAAVRAFKPVDIAPDHRALVKYVGLLIALATLAAVTPRGMAAR